MDNFGSLTVTGPVVPVRGNAVVLKNKKGTKPSGILIACWLFTSYFFTNSVCQHYRRTTLYAASHSCQTCQSVTPRPQRPAAFNTLMSESLPISHEVFTVRDDTRTWRLCSLTTTQLDNWVSSLMLLPINPRDISC